MLNFENKVNKRIASAMHVAIARKQLMQRQMTDKIECLVLLVAEFAASANVSESEAYRYLSQYGALALCDKHYNIMHTLSVEENIQTLREYCQRKGGTL